MSKTRKILILILLLPIFSIFLFSKTPKAEARAVGDCYSAEGANSTYDYYPLTAKYTTWTDSDNVRRCSETGVYTRGTYQTNKTGGRCNKINGAVRVCSSSSECGVIVTNKITRYNTFCSTYHQNAFAESDACQCQSAPKCDKKHVACGNRCGSFKQNCGQPDKQCGCGSNENCVNSSGNITSGNGTCKTKPSNPPPPSCPAGWCSNHPKKCQSQDNGCDCGACSAGFSCTGQNGANKNGECSKDPVKKFNVNVLVFYDLYGSGLKKGSEPNYNACFPATTGGNNPSGASSGNVTITVGKDSPVIKTSYRNCKTGGSGSKRGINITTGQRCKTVSYKPPTGYKVTGYNYNINGGATKTVTATNKSLKSTPSLCGDNVNVKFGLEKVASAPPPQVQGLVFIDDNNNSHWDPGEPTTDEPNGNYETCFSGDTTINVAGTNNTWTEDTGCGLFTYDKGAGSQTIRLNSIPANYEASGLEYIDDTHAPNASGDWPAIDSAAAATQESVNITGDGEVHFGIRPTPQTYSISGTIFTDTAPQDQLNGSNNHYTAGTNPTKSLTLYDSTGAQVGNPVVSAGSGYTFTNLDAGDYTVKYYDALTATSGPPAGYQTTWPNLVTPPQSFDVTVSTPPNCNINVGGGTKTQTRLKDAACDANGNITGLNFGIVPIGGNPWIQTVGGDMRSDADLTNSVPDAGSCSNTTQAYTSAADLVAPTMDPGIVFTAQSSAVLGASGSQNSKASSKGWLSLGNKFNPARGSVRTSYDYLKSVIKKGGVTIYSMYAGGNNDPNSPCGGTQKPFCTFPAPVGGAGAPASNFTAKVYETANNGLTIQGGPSSYTFANNTNYVFLINGDLRIERNIIVPVGSTVLFAVKGSITVATNVTTVEGIYSAGDNFTVESGGGVLNINGSVIVNANQNGGNITNNRDLGVGASGNGFCPSIKFTFRPDFVLNAPATVRIPNYIIQEVAPGPSYALPTTPPTYTPTNTPIPVINTLTYVGSPSNIPYNTKATLSWTTTGATSCVGTGFDAANTNGSGQSTNNLTANTTFTLNCSNVGGNATPKSVTVPVTPPVMATGYDASDGTVTMDAEAASPLATRFTRNDSWQNKTVLSFTGSAYIAALTDDGTNYSSGLAANAPEVRYNVCFPAADRYYIWLRGSAPDVNGDLVALGVDGIIPASANPMKLYVKDVDGTTDWLWKGKLSDTTRAYIDVPSAGFHNINLYDRNDGAKIDKIYLTNLSANPSFAGTAVNGPNATTPSISCVDNR